MYQIFSMWKEEPKLVYWFAFLIQVNTSSAGLVHLSPNPASTLSLSEMKSALFLLICISFS